MTRLLAHLILCTLLVSAVGLALGADGKLCAVVGVLMIVALLSAAMVPGTTSRHSVR